MFLILIHMASWQHELGCLLCLSTDVTCVTFLQPPFPYVTRHHNNVNSPTLSEHDIIYGWPQDEGQISQKSNKPEDEQAKGQTRQRANQPGGERARRWMSQAANRQRGDKGKVYFAECGNLKRCILRNFTYRMFRKLHLRFFLQSAKFK